MSFRDRSLLVGAYLCPRGAFAIVGKRRGAGIEVERTLEAPSELASHYEAADQLIQVLRSAGIDKADIAIAVRGFGVVHHVLQMPPASDAMLNPIIEREVRRMEPQLGDCVVDWISLPTLEIGTEAGPQRSLLAAAAPTDVVQDIAQRLGAAGFRLQHLTALPAAMQRLLEEFDDTPGSSGLAAPLPDGAFLGFSLDGGIRLVVEPPLPQGAEHELPALGEEIELGIMLVRQQFGASIERITLVGTKDSISDAESVLEERLQVPVTRLNIRDLSPAAVAALGAILDSQSAKPLSLSGAPRGREGRPASPVASSARAAIVLAALLGAWTMVETVRTKRAADSLQAARRRIEQQSFGLASVRSTADHRRLIRDAIAAVRLVAADRVSLQQALGGIAAAVRPPVRLDSLNLSRTEIGWEARVAGNVFGSTNARAVQALHDVYRELPQRLLVDSLRLDELAYSDSSDAVAGAAIVRFHLSFVIPAAKRD